MGKSSYNEKDHLAVGMLGMHGTAYANFAVSECDLLIALGARFDDRVTGKLEEFACEAEVLHFDIDPAEISKNRCPQLSIIGDIKKILVQLLKVLRKEPNFEINQTKTCTTAHKVPSRSTTLTCLRMTSIPSNRVTRCY